MTDALLLACQHTTDELLAALRVKLDNAQTRADFQEQRADDFAALLASERDQHAATVLRLQAAKRKLSATDVSKGVIERWRTHNTSASAES